MKTSPVFPFRHQLNGVSINIFSCSAPKRGRLSFCFFLLLFFCFFSLPPLGSDPRFSRCWTVTGLITNPGSKPSLRLVAQRKQATRWSPSLCTVNKYNAKTDYRTARTAYFLFLLLFFSFFLLTALCFSVTRREKLAGEVWWLMGKRSQTKLKTEKSESYRNGFSSVFGSLSAMKQQYILNLTHVWLYFVGRANMATAAFFRDLRAWDWSFVFVYFPFSIVMVDSHNHHPLYPSPLPPRRTLSSCFRDGVVMFCEGTAHTSTENKHYSCFSFSR